MRQVPETGYSFRDLGLPFPHLPILRSEFRATTAPVVPEHHEDRW
jgi:hypothetical protein